jgi:hypothetical protein
MVLSKSSLVDGSLNIMNEPPPPTLGTLQAIAKNFKKSEGKKGMALVIARLEALNGHYCWTPGLRNKEGTNWEQVNRHLWRIRALYQGGDCFLAGWPGALPNQKLWPTQTVNSNLADNFPHRVNKCQHYGATIESYSLPNPDDPVAWDGSA